MNKHIEEVFVQSKYNIHDSVVNRISIFDNKLVLEFEEGFFNSNNNKGILNKYNNCKMIFSTNNNVLDSIDIISTTYNLRKKIYKKLSVKKFIKLVSKNKLNILFEYRGQINKSVVLKGYLGFVKETYLTINDIKFIEYNHS